MDEPRRLGDRYELGAVLGRGGMAEVHMARDIRLGRTVAVKTLRADMSRDPTFQARFRREAQSAASLNHPSIVAVYDTGEDYVDAVPVPYIIMEYVDGSTLRDLLHSGRRLLPERAMEITAGVLQALEYSHEHGIVHRDIKPANVMLTRAGNVKVMDFGIARAVADNGMTMTQTAAVIGTAQYLSPEQAKGETVDARSDLYSTGCLLYELLTGRPPFTGDSPVAVAYQHVREEPQPPSVFDPEVSEVADAITLKSLAKRREDRYQSAGQMRADIDRALDGSPISAPTVLSAAAAAPTQRIDPRMASAPTSAYGPPTSAYRGEPYEDEGYPDDEPPRSRRGERSGRTGYIVLAVVGVAVLVAAAIVGYMLLNNSNGDQTQVPDLTGKTPAQATPLARTDGFSLQQGSNCGNTSSSTVPKGSIVSQKPQQNSTAKKGTTITYCLSSGQASADVPSDLQNQSYSSAHSELVSKGFTNIKETFKKSDSVASGDVIDVQVNGQSVVGQSEPLSQQLTVVVSQGQQTGTIPSGLIGSSQQSASQRLYTAGFNNINVVDSYSDSVQQGTVMSVNPPSGSTAPLSKTVTLTVSEGPSPTQSSPPPTSPSSNGGNSSSNGGNNGGTTGNPLGGLAGGNSSTGSTGGNSSTGSTGGNTGGNNTTSGQ